MATVTPKLIGTYPSLIGVPLRADVTLPGDEQLAGFEIELAEGRRAGRSKAWDSPRWRMTSVSHPGHDGQDEYAVDFNWGFGEADRGHPVRAAAKGRVSKVDRANGQVHIEHPRFDGESDWETVYAHLDPVLVKPGQQVKAQQRIGRIGSRYHGSGAISPHLHFQQRKDGKPVKMRLLLEGEEVPIGVSRRAPSGIVQWGRQARGWLRPRGPAPARLVVKVRNAADGHWSEENDLRFILATSDDPALDDRVGAFGTTVDADTDIAFDYNGPPVDPGEYTFRYRAIGDRGTQTPWAYDRSVIVEPALA